MTLVPGDRLGPYEIVAPLGSGGMGEVYRAKDARLGRAVAIKVLAGTVSRDAAARSRFEREARAVAALSHPNVLAIHDLGRDGETDSPESWRSSVSSPPPTGAPTPTPTCVS